MGDDHCDDQSIALQIQQFLDEWHFRVLHSHLAHDMDRQTAVLLALDLFGMFGVEFAPEEKEPFASMDEDQLIALLVEKMSQEQRKTFEHFALQLQLVISTTTRIRHALDDNNVEEMTHILEDGDSGIMQQILKQSVIEAGTEVGELLELRDSWTKNTESRLGRLGKSADEAESAKRQLKDIQGMIDGFGAEQNGKSKKVLMGMSDKNDKMLLAATFGAWSQWQSRFNAERDIHEKFKKEIADAETKLLEYKAGNIRNIKGVMARQAAGDNENLLKELWRCWVQEIRYSKDQAAKNAEMEAVNARLSGMKKSQQENSMKVMSRMSAGQDSGLLAMCMQSWSAFLEEAKSDKALEGAVKQAEEQLAEYMKQKKDHAKGVLGKMSGSTEMGLIKETFGLWLSVFNDEKHARLVDEQENGRDVTFKNLNKRQKGAARNVQERATALEQQNDLAIIFLNWACAARLERTLRHYAGKMDAKKNQLDAVQTMFKSFASQLEQGISNTPRTKQKSNRSKNSQAGSDASSVPPSVPT